MKKTITLILFFILIYSKSFAQIGIGTTTPAGQLDITSTQYGLLIPRVVLTAKNVDAPVANPQGGGLVISTMVYNTATAGVSPNNVVPGYYYWNGTIWIAFSSTASNGWILTGNSGTTAGTNFIGTTDNQNVIFKRNNYQSGLIGTSNTSFGLDALNPATTGNSNTATGVNALKQNIIGSRNTATGNSALATNLGDPSDSSFGCDNTATGYNSLNKNTTGRHNTANGASSLLSNVDGYFNTAIGSQALQANTNGYFNTAIGRAALLKNTNGYHNTANGSDALYSNTKGIRNTATGYCSIFSNTEGNNNTASGYSALYRSTGNDNTANGFNALLNTTGNANTALGNKAGDLITTGSNNIAIGNKAQVPSIDVDNQLSIGNVIYGTGVTGVSPAGNIGIGVKAPNSKMQIGGSLSLPITSVSISSYPISDSDYTIMAGAGTLTLPSAVGISGRIYVINRSSATAVTVTTSLGQTLLRAGTDMKPYSLNTTGGGYGMTVQSDDTNWQIIAINN